VADADPDPTDDEIEARLEAVLDDGWDTLWDAVDRLAAEETDHATWRGGEQVDTTVVDGVEQPVLHMPYVVYSDAVNRLVGRLSALGLIVPFNWPAWDGTRRFRTGQGMADAPVADAVRLITAIVRADRFSEGTIAVTIEDGTLPAAIERIRRWHVARARPGGTDSR
jgi:hypothetical protein